MVNVLSTRILRNQENNAVEQVLFVLKINSLGILAFYRPRDQSFYGYVSNGEHFKSNDLMCHSYSYFQELKDFFSKKRGKVCKINQPLSL